MDYKELIGRLKYYGTTYAVGDNLGREIDGTDQVMADAATAIETLLAGRDAAVEDLRGLYLMLCQRMRVQLRRESGEMP